MRHTALSLQAEARAWQDTGITSDEWADRQQAAWRDLLADGRYPVFAQVVRQPFEYDIEAVFEFGLRRWLDGMAALIDR